MLIENYHPSLDFGFWILDNGIVPTTVSASERSKGAISLELETFLFFGHSGHSSNLSLMTSSTVMNHSSKIGKERRVELIYKINLKSVGGSNTE